MNTRKAYRMLIVALFFVFISLISRSIIYLVLSVAIATMILFLLSSNKKVKNGHQLGKQDQIIGKKNKALNMFLWVLVVLGGAVLGYGSLFFTENTFFHQYLPISEKLLIAIVMIVIGFCIVLSSLYFLLRETLNVRKVTAVFCGHCGAKNNHDHTYCCSCGEKI